MRRFVHISAIVFLFSSAGSLLAHDGDGGVDVRGGKRLTVMTQNLYLGADLTRLLTPEVGNPFCDPVVSPLCLPATVNALVDTIGENNFPERAEALAARIKDEKPDLVGLQEVTLLRRQSPGDFLMNGQTNAQEIVIDYLQLLLAALDDEGIHYEVVAIVENFDVELPWLVGFDGAGPLLDDARLTDRDVLLARSNVQTSNPHAQNFTNAQVFTVGGVAISFNRGFVSCDARVRGVTYRVVNTHLEVQEDGAGGTVQAAQAWELIEILDSEVCPTVLIGDFNSGPDDGATQPYSLLASAGFIDLWTLQDTPGDGFTCCRSELLNSFPSILSDRVDILWVRNDLGVLGLSEVVAPEEIARLGATLEERTPSGLWLSDHAGVLAEVKIPRLRLEESDCDDDDDDEDED